MKNAMILRKIDNQAYIICAFAMSRYPSEALKSEYFSAITRLLRLGDRYPRFTKRIKEALKGNR